MVWQRPFAHNRMTLLQAKSASTSCWQNISVLPSQPGECPILFNQEGATTIFPNKNVSSAWPRQEGMKEKACDWPHTTEDERKLPRKTRSDNFDSKCSRHSTLMLYTVWCFPEGKRVQNRFLRFFKEHLSLSRRPPFWFGQESAVPISAPVRHSFQTWRH